MVIVPFRVVIPTERQDKRLVDKLKGELPGIFLWAIEGLRRLYAQRSFTEPSICRAALDDYRLEANPRKDVPDGLLPAKCGTALVSTDELYGSYKDWCQVHGEKPCNSRQFGKEVKRAFPNVRRVRVAMPGGRIYAYDGMAHEVYGPTRFLSAHPDAVQSGNK